MRIFIARHGQPALEGMAPGVNHEFPPGDCVLTALGRKQAAFLGGFLKKLDFHGRVISSPYARTMETASVAAGICGAAVFPEPRIQERRFYPDPPCPGLTIAELRRSFPNVDPAAELAFPWIVPGGPEEQEDVLRRVGAFTEEVLDRPQKEDLLLVGHGASVGALMRIFGTKARFTGDLGYSWNCALGGFELTDAGELVFLRPMGAEFIPEEFITSNRRRFGDPE